MQILHCIKQSSSGGENIVADAFRSAEIIRSQDPDCFKLLTETEFEYFDLGEDYIGKHHAQSRHPVIRYMRICYREILTYKLNTKRQMKCLQLDSSFKFGGCSSRQLVVAY